MGVYNLDETNLPKKFDKTVSLESFHRKKIIDGNKFFS